MGPRRKSTRKCRFRQANAIEMFRCFCYYWQSGYHAFCSLGECVDMERKQFNEKLNGTSAFLICTHALNFILYYEWKKKTMGNKVQWKSNETIHFGFVFVHNNVEDFTNLIFFYWIFEIMADWYLGTSNQSVSHFSKTSKIEHSFFKNDTHYFWLYFVFNSREKIVSKENEKKTLKFVINSWICFFQ